MVGKWWMGWRCCGEGPSTALPEAACLRRPKPADRPETHHMSHTLSHNSPCRAGDSVAAHTPPYRGASRVVGKEWMGWRSCREEAPQASESIGDKLANSGLSIYKLRLLLFMSWLSCSVHRWLCKKRMCSSISQRAS